MPNIKSAKKRVKITSVKTLRNKMTRSALRTALKRFDTAVAAGDKAAAETTMQTAVKLVDRAGTKGILHKNTAARRKSSMALRLNKLA